MTLQYFTNPLYVYSKFLEQKKNSKHLFVLTNKYLTRSLKIHSAVLKADMALNGLFENSEINTLSLNYLLWLWAVYNYWQKIIYADSNIIKAGTSAYTRQLFVNAEIKAKKEPTHHATNNNWQPPAHNLLKNILKGGRVRKQLSRSKVKLSSYAGASNCQSGSVGTLFFKLIFYERP